VVQPLSAGKTLAHRATVKRERADACSDARGRLPSSVEATLSDNNHRREVTMKVRILMSVVPTMLLAFVLNGTALAQSASQSMDSAGRSAAGAVNDVVKGTATAISDTALTTKIKTALNTDSEIHHTRIHVTTRGGVVILRGRVPSSVMKDRAEKIARDTEGVKDVKNQLEIYKRVSD